MCKEIVRDERGSGLIEVLIGLGILMVVLWGSAVVVRDYAAIERRIGSELEVLTQKLNSSERV